MSNVTSNNSRANECVWIDVGVTEKLSLVRLHLHQCTSWERSQRRTGRIDFVTEHPHMSSSDAPVLAALKTQHRQGTMLGKDLRGGRNHLKLAAMAATAALSIRDPGWPITSFHRRARIFCNTHTIQSIGTRGGKRRSSAHVVRGSRFT